MPDNDDLIVLDSALTSENVDAARHLARKMLSTAVDTLYEIGLNSDEKTSNRIAALKIFIDFAQAAKPQDTKRLLSKQVLPKGLRNKLARMGINGKGSQKQLPEVLPHEEEKERVGNRDDAAGGGEGIADGDGRLGPA